jgi:hypothetical protein
MVAGYANGAASSTGRGRDFPAVQVDPLVLVEDGGKVN